MEMWKSQGPDICFHYFNEVMKVIGDLNDWEVKFMGSIEGKVRVKQPLTELQEKKLLAIYNAYSIL